MTRSLPLERYFRDARGGLFQPPRDDLAPMLVGRTALAAQARAKAHVPSFFPASHLHIVNIINIVNHHLEQHFASA